MSRGRPAMQPARRESSGRRLRARPLVPNLERDPGRAGLRDDRAWSGTGRRPAPSEPQWPPRIAALQIIIGWPGCSLLDPPADLDARETEVQVEQDEVEGPQAREPLDPFAAVAGLDHLESLARGGTGRPGRGAGPRPRRASSFRAVSRLIVSSLERVSSVNLDPRLGIRAMARCSAWLAAAIRAHTESSPMLVSRRPHRASFAETARGAHG